MGREFFQPNAAGSDTVQLHIKLSAEDKQRLEKLTIAMRMSASDVIRTLIRSQIGRNAVAKKRAKQGG